MACCLNIYTSCNDQACYCVCADCTKVRERALLKGGVIAAAQKHGMLALNLNETPGCYEVLVVRNDREHPFEGCDVKTGPRGLILRRFASWESLESVRRGCPRILSVPNCLAAISPRSIAGGKPAS
jgi:hypothetical protein